MEKLGIKTDVITYNIALRQLARRGDVKAARELLAEMERDVAAPNVQT